MVNVVVLSATGESRTLKTTAIGAASASGEAVAKALRRKVAAERIGTYTWKGRTLVLWGWREGKAGTENKHELPPPHDEVLLFGDAIVVVDGGGDLTVEDWSVFYDAAFGGFEDLGSEDSEEEDDEEDEEEDESGGGDDGEDGEAEDEDDDESSDEEDDEDGDAGDDEEEEVEEAEEEDNDECYDDGEDGGGGGKRRAPRRRTVATPDCRRIDMGLRSRIKLPTPVGKRAPRWQTAPELEEETYDV
jgi:hypothetical protein